MCTLVVARAWGGLGALPVTCQRSDFSGKGKEVPGVVSGAHIILYSARLFIAYRVWLRVWLCGTAVVAGYTRQIEPPPTKPHVSPAGSTTAAEVEAKTIVSRTPRQQDLILAHRIVRQMSR